MAWIVIVGAGIAEIAFAVSLGASDGFSQPIASIGTVVFGVLAVLLLSKALREIPLSVGYAAFTGIGAIGTAIVGVCVRDEPITAARLGAFVLVVAGVISLRLTSGTAS